jgi:mannose-6-phosphate isomerase
MPINYPLFFAPNRVWRCYTGGVLLDRFIGNAREADGHVPEDWLASTVRAINGDSSQGPDEGLARTVDGDGRPGPLLAELQDTRAEELFGPDHVARFGRNMALLCKYLDSAVRLPIQCHPDVPIARKLYGSPFGKTECWHILDTRDIGGHKPYLLMGFRPGVTREKFGRAVMGQDIAAMESMLHKVHARPGETYFVPARLPHAIGPGVFMIEVQEPSDWGVQAERLCADTRLSDEAMWGRLAPDQGLDVFEYAAVNEKELLARVVPKEKIVTREDGGLVAEIIGADLTPAFSLWRAEVSGTMRIALPFPFALAVATRGHGMMRWEGGSRAIARGQYFLQPFGVKWVEYAAQEPLSLVFGLPPKS